jgi:ADP-ribosylglycohydrolase
MTDRLDPGALDRALGAVLGSACGDALGAGYEGWHYNSLLPADPADLAMIGGGLGSWNEGEWTDDTQMALGILDVLAERQGDGPVDLVAIGQNFLDWADTNPPDIGNHTRAVLQANVDAVDLRAWSDEVQELNGDSVGNGGLMRCAPVALMAPHDREAVAHLAAEASRLTHSHADSQEACVLWCEAIRQAIGGASPDSAVQWKELVVSGLDLVSDGRRAVWEERIDEAVQLPQEAFNENGWVVWAFQAALSAIVHTPVPAGEPAHHLAEVLRTAVMIGGDTDTVAAIAGALVGARWGESALPEDWLDILHGTRRKGEPVVRAAGLGGLVRSALGG